MKQYLFLCLFFATVLMHLSCSNQSSPTEKPALHPDTLAALKKDSLSTSIQKISHPNSVLDSLYILSDRLAKCSTAEEVTLHLQELIVVKNEVSAQWDSLFAATYNSDFDGFEKYIKPITSQVPLLSFIWIEEGSRPYLTLNWKALVLLAKKTKGDADDNYFQLNNDVYEGAGEYSITMPVWIVMKTDISGSSRLGDSTFSNLLTRLNAFQNQDKTIFNKEYKIMRGNLIADMLDMSRFENSKKNVLQELNAISNFNFLTKDEKEQVQNYIKTLNDPKDASQFNCEEADCNYE